MYSGKIKIWIEDESNFINSTEIKLDNKKFNEEQQELISEVTYILSKHLGIITFKAWNITIKKQKERIRDMELKNCFLTM